jgi:hypothetical protein
MGTVPEPGTAVLPITPKRHQSIGAIHAQLYSIVFLDYGGLSVCGLAA